MLLQKGFGLQALLQVGTHSLKATPLSWCAKGGVAREQRQILGYQSIPGVKAMLHYSRDEQSGPLRFLTEVIEHVRSWSFDPDASCSGRYLPKKKDSKTPTSERSSQSIGPQLPVQGQIPLLLRRPLLAVFLQVRQLIRLRRYKKTRRGRLVGQWMSFRHGLRAAERRIGVFHLAHGKNSCFQDLKKLRFLKGLNLL